MCDYLERMEKINVPTEEIRLWSGLAHRVVEYASPFPIPEDVVIMLWLHEESATILLDMCDDIDEKFSELETENAKLRRFAKMFAQVADEVGCDHCPYCEPDLCDEEIDPMKDGCRLYDELRELGIEV